MKGCSVACYSIFSEESYCFHTSLVASSEWMDAVVFASWDLELEAAGSMELQFFGVDFGYVESEENDAF